MKIRKLDTSEVINVFFFPFFFLSFFFPCPLLALWVFIKCQTFPLDSFLGKADWAQGGRLGDRSKRALKPLKKQKKMKKKGGIELSIFIQQPGYWVMLINVLL